MGYFYNKLIFIVILNYIIAIDTIKTSSINDGGLGRGAHGGQSRFQELRLNSFYRRSYFEYFVPG